MPRVTRDQQIEVLLAVAPSCVRDGLVRVTDLERAARVCRSRLYELIRHLRAVDRWPYTIDSTKAPKPTPEELAASKPRQEPRPSVSDVEAFRAWAERERERLATIQHRTLDSVLPSHADFKFTCGKESK